METATITPTVRTCATCPEFQASERTPNTGCCLIHMVNVLGTDKGCSSWYQEPEPTETSDEEF